jgi:hypothetical protein
MKRKEKGMQGVVGHVRQTFTFALKQHSVPKKKALILFSKILTLSYSTFSNP